MNYLKSIFILAAFGCLIACSKSNDSSPSGGTLGPVAGAVDFKSLSCEKKQDKAVKRPSVNQCDPQLVKDLFKAVDGNCLDVVKNILQKNVNVDMTRNAGGSGLPDDQETPLIVASRMGYLEIAQELVAKKSSPNFVMRTGCGLGGCNRFHYTTPLHTAAKNGDVEMVKLFVQNGADVNQAIGGTFTPLVSAIRASSLETMKYLIASGADVNAHGTFDYEYYNPLLDAASVDHCEMVETLVQNGAKPEFSKFVLSTLAQHNQAYAIELLLSHGAQWTPGVEDLDRAGPFYRAIQSNAFEATQVLFAHGYKKIYEWDGTEKFPALGSACTVDIANFLIQNGLDVNPVDHTKPNVLGVCPKSDVIQFLLNNGYKADVASADGWTPLLRVAMVEKLEDASWQKLIAAGANINARTSYKESVLSLAVTANNLNLVKFLVANGADVNWQGRNDETAIMQIEVKNLESVKAVLDHGADAKLVSHSEETALSRAVRHLGNIYADGPVLNSILSLMIANGANANHMAPNAWPPSSRTPVLMNAIRNIKSGNDLQKLTVPTAAQLESIEILLKGGADPKLSASSDGTYCAMTMDSYSEVNALLKKYGGSTCH